MASHSLRFCAHSGCTHLTADRFCADHAAEAVRGPDLRASASARGYDHRWTRFARWYLSQPDHQFCALHISPQCKGLAECVDHIHPLQGPDDPDRFALSNLQPACLACNTLKGRRVLVGAHRANQ